MQHYVHFDQYLFRIATSNFNPFNEINFNEIMLIQHVFTENESLLCFCYLLKSCKLIWNRSWVYNFPCEAQFHIGFQFFAKRDLIKKIDFDFTREGGRGNLSHIYT